MSFDTDRMLSARRIMIVGGPGAGKSTTAAGLFYTLKTEGINCEYVTEQAKNFTWEERQVTLSCQPYVFGKQMRDLWRLRNKVDVAICDSPLLLSLMYTDDSWPASFKTYVRDQFDTFDNLNFFLERGERPYNPIGRNQKLKQSQDIDRKILGMLLDSQVDHAIIRTSDGERIDKIKSLLLKKMIKNT